jgi:hypothetical protein
MALKAKDAQLFEYIKANHQNKSARTISKDLGIPATTVRRKAKLIGIKFEHNVSLRIVSSELDKDIGENYYKEATTAIARRHGLSAKKVYSRALELGFESKLTVGRRGNKQSDLAFIVLNYGKMTIKSLADELNTTVNRVNRLITSIKLR